METTNIQQAINLIDQIDSLMLDLCEELDVEQLGNVLECKQSFDNLRSELEDRLKPDVKLIIENGNITVLQEDICR